MASNPILTVLNSSAYLGEWERQLGGQKKDFYLNANADFIDHKAKLERQLEAIKIVRNNYSEVCYAKLILKPSALAKSHRPTSSLFRKDLAPIVGAGDIGELFVELNPSSIETLTNKIDKAETEVRLKTRGDGKVVQAPSALRSEVGAIDDILPYTKSDKRKFSVRDGLRWLSKTTTGGGYIVELFENPIPTINLPSLSPLKARLFESFYNGLNDFGNGLVVSRLFSKGNDFPTLQMRIEATDNTPKIELFSKYIPGLYYDEKPSINLDINRHAELIEFLDSHPLVRKIKLPPTFKASSNRDKFIKGDTFGITSADASKKYPKVGVIDGGISSYFDDWIESRSNYLAPVDRDENHGSFIAGLLLAGQQLNGKEVCTEPDGCKIIDVGIVPDELSFLNYYPNPLEMFSQLAIEVNDLKTTTGVRIFNFSLNTEEHVSSDEYSYAAKMLDIISEENDVIFVVAAGNTEPIDLRTEWSNDPIESLSILASSKNDSIKNPSESSRNISVSALNPPNISGIVPYAPSSYSCRGPGLRTGLKPDLAHVGGAGPNLSRKGHGFLSLSPDGAVTEGCGTSYACPQVAKTLASLQNLIEGNVSRETLIALAIHSATPPVALLDKRLAKVAKHLVGFGIPQNAETILSDNPHAITLVFANRVLPGHKLSFQFNWPESLTIAGKCFGEVRLTLVSTPPFNYSYGAEYVRVNLEAHLRQEQKKGGFKGQLEAIYTPDNNSQSSNEQNLIKHSFKWSPIKVYERALKGVGESSNWKLEIEHLVRDGETFPPAGIPFTAILTIKDPEMKSPIHDEMRKSLLSVGVRLGDIKTAAKIVSRV